MKIRNLPGTLLFPNIKAAEFFDTERLSEEKAIQLAAIVESSEDIILSKNLDGIITSWNKGAESTYGYTAAEVFGKPVSILLPDDFEDETLKFMEIIKSGSHVKHFETLRRTKSGKQIHVSLSISPIRTINGEIVGASTIGHDITLRKSLEEELRQKNMELIRTNIEKDKFLSVVAHDLRGPFNAFLGFTRILDEELISFTMEEIQEYATHMRKSADKLYLLLENLLEWSSIRNGIGSFNPVQFQLMPKIESALEIVSDFADKKFIKIINTIPEGLKVCADPKMFKSLFRNIIFNAVKFTPEGGEITVTAITLPGNEIQISVKDTGIGMSEELMAKLFRIDQFVSRKGTNDEPSSGLGLIICKDYIEKTGEKYGSKAKLTTEVLFILLCLAFRNTTPC